LAVEISRRVFIKALGGSAPAASLYGTLGAMGLLPTPTAYARPPRLPANDGRGVTVVILGAGIAGMTAGYQLRKAGYHCVILEARERAGGRVWTLRGGDRIVETDSVQRINSVQHINWDRQRHLYFNAGAARISHHHTGVLGYCREFDIPLEIFVSDNRAALIQTDKAFGGEPQPLRRVIMDGRGAVAALAAKAVASSDTELRTFLMGFGALQGDMTYAGTGWAGYQTPPGGGLQAGQPYKPLPLDEIAKAAGNPKNINPLVAMIFAEIWEQSPTMLQPVGGMDAIPRAFAGALGGMIKYQAQVSRIERQGKRARVTWRDRKTTHIHTMEADVVICTLPLPVLRSIANDFSPAVKCAIEKGAKHYVPAVKVAFQSDRRWWETDHQLYGGISWTARDITQIWYPSHGFHERNGIIVGAYIWDAIGATFAVKTPAERVRAAIEDGERLHPGYASLVGRGVSVAWPGIPFSEGGWCEWTDAERKDSYAVLVSGEGPFYFAGEHMSYIPGWQEGAVQSAHYAVHQITKQLRTCRN
jgi:monoamine oxidase